MTISRRTFLERASLAAAAALLPSRHLFGQGDAIAQMRAGGATAKIAIVPARRNVSILMGSGGNIAVLPGKDGKLLVDSGFATSQTQIAAALASLGTEPPSHLIDTHWHFDHTDGNLWMHSAGAAIIAHENTKKRLGTPQVIAAFHASFPPAPAGALPATVFSQTYRLESNGETIDLSPTTPPRTRTPTSPSTSPTQMSSTSAIPGSTGSTRSSTTPAAAASTA